MTADAVPVAAPRRHRRASQVVRRPHRLRTAGRYLLLVSASAAILFPVYVTFLNSLLPADELLRHPQLLPRRLVATGYRDVWNDGQLRQYLVNSFVMASLITVGQLATSITSAYAFAFLRFPLRRVLFVIFLASLMVPFEVTLITNVETISELGWKNSYPGLVVPFLATALGTFLLRQAFLGVPRDLQDAAALDGYGHLRFLSRVVMPVARPTIAALAVFSFLLSWNQYLWPLLITDDDRYRTVQIGLKQLVSQNIDDFNAVFAGTVLAALPIFVLLVVFQKQLVRGLTAGGVKG